MIREIVSKFKRYVVKRYVKDKIVGQCPECGEVLRMDKNGNRVPPNPLEGEEHYPGVHYKCPNRYGSLSMMRIREIFEIMTWKK